MTTPTVAAAFRKPARDAPLEPGDPLVCRAGVGIDGDRGAQPGSSRQVLLVDRAVLADLDLPDGALRENLTVDGLTVDDVPSGTALRVGSATLRVTIPCDPCGKIPSFAGIHPAAVHTRRGMLAVVTGTGEIRAGDAVVDLGVRYDPVPVSPLQRCAWVARQVPPGEVITFTQAVTAMGMAEAYVRALPRHVRRLLGDEPVHRLVPTDPATPLDDEQAARLRAEGAAIDEQGRRCGEPWPFTEPFTAADPDRERA